MRFGIGLSVQHPPDDPPAARFAEHLEQVRVARSAGFHSVWASQHYLSDPFTYFQPIPTLARVAAEAGGMTLGTGILLLPLLHPVDVAEQLATLDAICGGRLVVGVGLGYRDVETEAMGLDPRTRVSRFEEALDVVERLWGGEPVSYQGKHFRLRDVRVSMRPLQRPRPPIWLAANADPGVERAARLADAWLMNPHTTLDTLARQLAAFHAARRRLGRPPARAVPLIRECYVAPDTRTAMEEARVFLEAKYRAYVSWEQDKALPPGESLRQDFDALARERFVIGDPACVREALARCRDRLGVTDVIFRLQWPGLPQERVLRSIRLLGESVLPHFVS